MKKIALFLAFALLCGLLCGCSGKNAETYEELKLNQFVTLGEYKGLSYTKPNIAVSDQEITDTINQLMKDQGYAISPKTVEDGDTVNIDYKGLKDGVAFSGGTAENYNLVIGSGSFIDGFEEGLIGKKVGTTVKLNLTFPEQYHSAELAGQAVVFEVTINSVPSRLTYPELTDSLAVKLNKDVKTKDELIQLTKKNLTEQKTEKANIAIEKEIWSQAVQNATFEEKLPKKILEKTNTQFEEYYTSISLQYNYSDLDSFLSANNLSRDTLSQWAASTVKEQLTAYAIAEAEGYSVSDEEFQKCALELATENGYAEDLDTYIEAIGKDAIKDEVVRRFAIETILNNAKAK